MHGHRWCANIFMGDGMMDITLSIDEQIAKMSLPELTELLKTVADEISQRAITLGTELEDTMQQ